MAEIETGFRWWVRYVIVPIVGGGGVIAILVALLSQHNTVQPKAQNADPTPTTSSSPQNTMSQPASASTKAAAKEPIPKNDKRGTLAIRLASSARWESKRIDVKWGAEVFLKWHVAKPVGTLAIVVDTGEGIMLTNALGAPDGEDFCWVMQDMKPESPGEFLENDPQPNTVRLRKVYLQDSAQGMLTSVDVYVH
jgi:hypothetical protein